MENKYFINGDKSDPYTWNEILYWCYTNIANFTWRYNNGKYGYYPGLRYHNGVCIGTEDGKSQSFINFFFSGFKNNNNDGRYWTYGKYEQVFVGYDEETGRKIYKNGNWLPPKLIYKTYGHYITDSYNRTIPSGYIKDVYLKYIPDISHKHQRPKKRYHYKDSGTPDNDGYVFRCGPVPGGRGHKYKNRAGHRYQGNHCGITPWKRDWYISRLDSKEIHKEFALSIKLPDKIAYRHNHTGYHGWKRTRKKKQWM